MKNLTLIFVFFCSFSLLSQEQNPKAMDVVSHKHFWRTTGHTGRISRQIVLDKFQNIKKDGIYKISIAGVIYRVNVDIVTPDETTHIIFKPTQNGKKNYTLKSKNYLDADGGIIWSFANDPSREWFAACGNEIAKTVRFKQSPIINSSIITDATIADTTCDTYINLYYKSLNLYKTGQIGYEFILREYKEISSTKCGSNISLPQKRTRGTIDPPVCNKCNKEEGQQKIYERLLRYETSDIFDMRKNAQNDIDAILRLYPCLEYVRVKRAHKLWKKGKPFFIAGAALTTGYLVWKNNRGTRSANNSSSGWGVNPSSVGNRYGL